MGRYNPLFFVLFGVEARRGGVRNGARNGYHQTAQLPELGQRCPRPHGGGTGHDQVGNLLCYLPENPPPVKHGIFPSEGKKETGMTPDSGGSAGRVSVSVCVCDEHVLGGCPAVSADAAEMKLDNWWRPLIKKGHLSLTLLCCPPRLGKARSWSLPVALRGGGGAGIRHRQLKPSRRGQAEGSAIGRFLLCDGRSYPLDHICKTLSNPVLAPSPAGASRLLAEDTLKPARYATKYQHCLLLPYDVILRRLIEYSQSILSAFALKRVQQAIEERLAKCGSSPHAVL